MMSVRGHVGGIWCRTPFILHAAFSTFHELLPAPKNSVLNHSDLIPACRTAGISKICFLRHGKTGPTSNGVDFDRLLTDEGRHQAIEAGSSFGTEMKPFFPIVMVSPAPRTLETAQLFVEAAGAEVELLPIQEMYDGTMQPQGSALFRQLGYAPLTNYLNHQDTTFRSTARAVLGAYAHTAAEEIEKTIQTNQFRQVEKCTTLWFVGHAIYLPAAALGIASLAECDQGSLDMILSVNTKEAEAFAVDLHKSEAHYVSRPSSNGG